MGKIDDPIEATKEAYGVGEGGDHGPTELVRFAAERVAELVPGVNILKALSDHFTGSAAARRVDDLIDEIFNIMKAQEADIQKAARRMESPEFIETLIVAADHTARTASKKKVKRFAAVLAHEALGGGDGQSLEDAAVFIRNLAELTEADIEVLSLLSSREADNSEYEDTSGIDWDSAPVAHLNTFKSGDHFARCLRLSGYGLVLPLGRIRDEEVKADTLGFVITALGRELVSILKRVNVGGDDD